MAWRAAHQYHTTAMASLTVRTAFIESTPQRSTPPMTSTTPPAPSRRADIFDVPTYTVAVKPNATASATDKKHNHTRKGRPLPFDDEEDDTARGLA